MCWLYCVLLVSRCLHALLLGYEASNVEVVRSLGGFLIVVGLSTLTRPLLFGRYILFSVVGPQPLHDHALATVDVAEVGESGLAAGRLPALPHSSLERAGWLT